MRKLFYVPVIHDQADLGNLGKAVVLQSAQQLGDRRWALHQETACKFWRCIRAYLLSHDLSQVKVYQDGLAADGEIGWRIVPEATKRGSENYRIVLELLQRGAELRKTEDPILLIHEHENITRALQQRPTDEGPPNAEEDCQQRERLLEDRDRFIAQTISETLREGEVGVLFMGANHSIASRLPADISVEAAKDPRRVRVYIKELFLGQDVGRLEELGKYLASPVEHLTSLTGGN